MSWQVVRESPKLPGIPAADMECGDVGEIVMWEDRDAYCGRVVLRYGEALILIGEDFGCSFGTYFRVGSVVSEHRIRLLEPGDRIENQGRKDA